MITPGSRSQKSGIALALSGIAFLLVQVGSVLSGDATVFDAISALARDENVQLAITMVLNGWGLFGLAEKVDRKANENVEASHHVMSDEGY